jgi:cell division septum initiation protein DivIVA
VPYTPVELRHIRVGRGLLGYKRDAVDRLLDEVADSFEDVWRERGELGDKVEQLERQLAELKSREDTLVRSLVAAEQSAADTREHAKREAELIIAEAHQEARSIKRGAQSEHARLAAEVRRIEALLRAALGMVEESAREAPADAAPAGAQKLPESWPRRDDTREFPRTVHPVPKLPNEPEAQAR